MIPPPDMPKFNLSAGDRPPSRNFTEGIRVAKGFGLLGLIIVVLSTQLMLGANLVVGFIGLTFVTIGALGGDKMFSIAAVGVFLVALIFMSPLTLAVLIGGGIGLSWFTGIPGIAWLVGVIVFSLLPLIAMFLHATGRLILASAKSPATD